jgi:IclR family transcriptional regulator, acetate operon repressor
VLGHLVTEQARRHTAPGSNTLLRGLVVLESVAHESSQNGISVTEVAALTGLDKSTVSRTLAALRDAGYLRQDARRRYRLTSKLARLAEGHLWTADLRNVAEAHLERLHERFDEELHLAILDGGEMVFIDYRPSTKSVRSNLPTVPAPAHLTAVGRAVLAALPHDERASVLQEAVRVSGEKLDRSVATELSEEIAISQRRGWAGYDAGDDVTRIAAAILDGTGAPIGALCLAGPSYRLAQRTPELAREVVAAAQGISRDVTRLGTGLTASLPPA